MKSEIRLAREAARLTRKQVSDPLNRTTEWLRRIESGTLRLSPEMREKILQVIKTLVDMRAEFQAKTAEALTRIVLGNDGNDRHARRA